MSDPRSRVATLDDEGEVPVVDVQEFDDADADLSLKEPLTVHGFIPLAVGELVAALARAQLKIEPPVKSKTAKVETKSGQDYQYSYADLAAVIASCRGPLAAEGIAWTQDATTAAGTPPTVSVTTTLRRGDEVLEFGPFVLPVLISTPQGFGSALTYARRYALTAALGIASEEDDDAQLASRVGGAKGRKASEAQMKRLHALAKDKGKSHQDLRDWAGVHLGIESLTELTTSGARELSEALEALPNVEAGEAEPGAADTPDASPGDTPSGPPASTPTEAPNGAEKPGDSQKQLLDEAVALAGSRRALLDWYRDEFQVTGTVSTKQLYEGDVLARLVALMKEAKGLA
jgi:hypothetical protein